MPLNIAKELEVNNILIVESKNDKIFVEALISFMQINQQIDTRICIDDYRSLEGLNAQKLINALKVIKDDSTKVNIEKVGIIIDQDNFTKHDRITWLNDCLKQVFSPDISLLNTGEFIDIYNDYGDLISLGCYFVNVDGQGELETVLKTIKTQDSPYSDCLENWRDCLINQGKNITQKDFDKFWISNYLKFDTCTSEEKRQSGKKCSMSGFDYVRQNKSHIWNFDHPILDNLKQFLQLFV